MNKFLEMKRKGKVFEKRQAGFVDSVGENQTTYKGVKSGVVEGYIATWDKDRGNDVFHPGAFLDSIADMQRRNRDLRLKDMHGRTIGVFDHTTLREDHKGLWGRGYINLEVQQGQEAYSLAKQGAYDSFSVGFSVPHGESKGEFPYGREIYKATLWEGSIVDEPMNEFAEVTAVKSVTDFADLPLASEDRSWDSTEADRRVRAWADAENEPNDRYKRAFLWFDQDNQDQFGGYRFPIADVIDGELMAVPRGIFAAAAAIQGARTETTIPDEDKSRIRTHLDRYYAKMDRESPWGRKMLGNILGTEEEIKAMTVREIESALVESGCSEKQAKTLISNMKKVGVDADHEQQEKEQEEKFLGDLMSELKSFGDTLAG